MSNTDDTDSTENTDKRFMVLNFRKTFFGVFENLFG